MIPHRDRQKGGAPLLGARHEDQCGPFGEYGGGDLDEDHDQAGEQQPDEPSA